MASFRSEIHIPIKKDDLNFQDRQIQRWGDMETQMEQRKKQWEGEFEKMRKDFFTLKPSEKLDQNRRESGQFDSLKSFYEVDSDGVTKFKVRFDVSEFQPEEIQVKMHDNKIAINARHEEKSTASQISREYSRQVDIPHDVDQDKLQCLMSKDGILCVEGPLLQQSILKQTVLPIKSDSPKSLEVATPVKNPIITDADGTRKLRLQVDVGEFSPDEIVVKTMERKLIVHAEHEEKTQGRTLHKEFNKEYDLPESVDPNTITAYIGDDKNLTIEAPLKAVQRKAYSVTQSHDVQKVVVSKDSSVTITDGRNRPMVTISVHRR
ncbi:hypothetical protein SNE40_003055 [Patella caerulea]|uniref:SHSP domain-containing protein n=1 Tax=Patella caerulea TaxID=87958 RepID=A0AAN8K9T0_PATCE